MVRDGRLELPTSCSQSKRATNCANPGFLVIQFYSRCGQTCGQADFLTTSAYGEIACISGVSRDCGHGIFRLEGGATRSKTRRDTNFAIPGYSISAMIPRRTVKIKFFLSVVIPVVKAAFMPFSTTGGNPANAGATRLSSVLPCSVSDTATALPKQARYQLRYTRLFRYFIRLVVFSQTRRDTNFAIPRYTVSARCLRMLPVPCQGCALTNTVKYYSRSGERCPAKMKIFRAKKRQRRCLFSDIFTSCG